MRQKQLFYVCVLIVMLSLACSLSLPDSSTLDDPISSTDAAVPTQEPVMALPSTNLLMRECDPIASDLSEWCYLSGGTARAIPAPQDAYGFLSYSPQTDRVLYLSNLTNDGVGPRAISAGELWVFDINAGASEPVLVDQTTIAAQWTPNGQDFIYLIATPDTYALHWRAKSGEDRLLASDVNNLFQISPSGDMVAFTRRGENRVDGRKPGLFVVSVTGADERHLADFDAFNGSIDDTINWSLDSTQIIMPVLSETGPRAALVRAAADGSSTAQFSLNSESDTTRPYSDANVFGGVPFWTSDGQHLLATAITGSMQGGDLRFFIVQYDLDPALGSVTSWRILFEDLRLLGWDIPGQSIWVHPPDAPPNTILLTVDNTP